MRRGRTSTIPDEGHADGGTPYTDEEMDIIDAEEAAGEGRMAPGAPLEGLPTPPLARDRAAETGKPVQDCFGGWHGRSREGGPPGGRAGRMGRLAGRIIAEAVGEPGSRAAYAMASRWFPEGVEVVLYDAGFRRLEKTTMSQDRADALPVEWVSPEQVWRWQVGARGGRPEGGPGRT